MLKRCIYNLPMVFVYLVLCTVLFLFNGIGGDERLWDQYYTVAVPAGDAEKIISDNIFGGRDIVSYYTTELSYNDFGTFRKIALADIDQRFVKGDPRVDSFMLSARDYFFTSDDAGNDYELIYVKSNEPVWRFYLYSRIILRSVSSEWIFPDFNLENRLISAALFSLCWILAVKIMRGKRIIAVFAGLPWFIAVLVNGASMLAPASAVLLLFILLIREMFPDLLYHMNYGSLRIESRIFLYAAALVIAVTANIIYSAIESKPVLPVILAVAADVAVMMVYFSLKRQRVRMQEHRLFFPVSLASRSVNEGAGVRVPELAAVLTAIVLIPMFVLFYQNSTSIEVPVPQKAAGSFSDWSWKSLEFVDKSYDGMVNAADLLSHAAFQDGFMYGREYRFPMPGEEITVDKYVAVNNEIEYRRTCIRQFTDNWYISIIKPELSTGLTALLLSQNSPGGIILKSDISEAVDGFKPVGHLIFSLMAILPVLWQFISNVSITLRRKGQEA